MYFTKFVPQGSVVFDEGSKGNTAFVIVSGKVEISKRVGDKKAILDVMGPGCIFGEMALLGTESRTATAQAVEPTELVVINKNKLLELLEQSPPILKTIISSLVQRLATTNERIRVQASDNLYFSVCNILEILFRGQNQGQSLPYSRVIENIKGIISISMHDCEVILDKLASLNLIEIQKDRSGRRSLCLVDGEGFPQRYRETLEEFLDALPTFWRQRSELMDISDLASYLEVEPKKIYRKIAQEEFPESLFLFKREAVLPWAEEKGKEFFEKTKKRRISVDEVEDLSDIVYLDNSTLRPTLNKLGDYKVSLLLRIADEEVQKKILTNLPRRIRELVEEELGSAEWLDEAEAEDVEYEFIETLKSTSRQTPQTVVESLPDRG